MRPIKVGINILSDFEGIIIGKGNKRNGSWSTKRIPQFDISHSIQYSCLLKDSSYNGLPYRTPSHLFLPPVLIHFLLIQLQKYPSLIPPNIQRQIWMIRNLSSKLMINSIIYAFKWCYLWGFWWGCYWAGLWEWELCDCHRLGLMGEQIVILLLD